MVIEDSTLDGRVALVTGAGRGIGRATALALAKCGAAVVVNDLGSDLEGRDQGEDPASLVAAEIEAAGGRSLSNRDSVSEWEGAQRIIGTALDEFGRIDLLVSSAGLSAGTAVWELDPDVFDRVVKSHLYGSFHCLRAAAPFMKAQGSGHVIHLVSRAGLVGMPGTAAYGAAKGGVFGLTLAASHDLAPFGIRVNAVNPAATETRMVTTAIDALAGADESSGRRAAGLVAALQPPERVAALIAALCHEEAGSFTGQTFYIDKESIGLFPALRAEQANRCPGPLTTSEALEALRRLVPAAAETPYEN